MSKSQTTDGRIGSAIFGGVFGLIASVIVAGFVNGTVAMLIWLSPPCVLAGAILFAKFGCGRSVSIHLGDDGHWGDDGCDDGD